MKKRRKILGIDASRSTRDKPTGVEYYSTEIIRAILPLASDFDIRLYTPEWIPAFPRNVQRKLWCPRLWTLFRLSLEMLLYKPDILFIPAHVLPFFAPSRSFVTLHDIAFEKMSKAYPTLQRLYLRWSTKRALRKAEKIFVPSKGVKKDLMNFYKGESENVLVLPHGIPPLLSVKQSEILAFYKKYPFDKTGPVFFFLGRLDAKKNLGVLLDAWNQVRKIRPDACLVLGGSFAYQSKKLLDRIRRMRKVLTPGYLSEKEVSILFHIATGFVFPSKEEGFGLPLLQAFEGGCPVIAFDRPVIREVGRKAVLLARIDDAKDLAQHMLRLTENKKLREELAKKGKERLKHFSWIKSAREMVRIFKID